MYDREIKDEKHLLRVNLSDVDYNDLIDKTVVELLTNGLKYKTQIIANLTTAFANKNNIDGISISTMRVRPFSKVGAFTEGEFNSVTIKETQFTNPAAFIKDLSILYHELTHIKTYKNNLGKSVLRGEKYDYNCSPAAEEMYFSAPNEHNSFLAETEWSKFVCERMAKVMNEHPELKTKQNEKLLKSYLKTISKNEKVNNSHYNKSIKKLNDPKQRAYRKSEAESFLDILKHKELTDEEDFRYHSYIIDYINAYKDKDFVYKYIQSGNLRDTDLEIILNSGTFKRSDLSSLYMQLKDVYGRNTQYNDTMRDMISEEDVKKHNYLFFDNFNGEYIVGSDEFKGYRFNGLPIKYDIVNGYQINVYDETLQAKNLKDLRIELTKHIDLTMLDDFNEITIAIINTMFGCEVVQELKKEKEIPVVENKEIKEQEAIAETIKETQPVKRNYGEVERTFRKTTF